MPDLLISVVIPVFNSANTLEATLLSIAAQSRKPDEVVIVDDGSRDNLQEVLARNKKGLPITLITNAQNRGIGFSLRAGVERSIGDLIFRIDADDSWDPEYLTLSEQVFLNSSEVVLCNSSARLVDQSGKQLGLHAAIDDADARRALMSDNPFIHSGVSFRKAAYFQVGGYPQGIRWEDYSLWIEMASLGKIGSVPQVTLNYFVSPNSLSRVARGTALRDRWLCQKKAISLFGKHYPVTAFLSFVAFCVKMILLKFSK
jgi:GT2 family glycosyltransferase